MSRRQSVCRLCLWRERAQGLVLCFRQLLLLLHLLIC